MVAISTIYKSGLTDLPIHLFFSSLCITILPKTQDYHATNRNTKATLMAREVCTRKSTTCALWRKGGLEKRGY